MERIFLDHAATTPLHPLAREAMLPWLRDEFGNPSSLYLSGRAAKEAIDIAREGISQHLGCEFGEVVFTSSGTEAANFALIGTVLCSRDTRRKKILFSAVEHHCVLNCKPMLERLGFAVILVPVGNTGLVDLNQLESLIDDETLLVSVMTVNNELGCAQPVGQIAAMARAKGAIFHSDAVQSFATTTTDAGMVSFSAHKFGGPKGVGGLYVSKHVELEPTLVGGSQERGRRAGTENVAGIVGMHAALKHWQTPARELKDNFLEVLANSFPLGEGWSSVSETDGVKGFILTCPDSVDHIAHLRFPGIRAESLLIALDRMGIEASSGAACSSGSLEPSHVLLACGYSAEEAKQCVRFSFGPANTVEQMREAAIRVNEAVANIRQAAKR